MKVGLGKTLVLVLQRASMTRFLKTTELLTIRRRVTPCARKGQLCCKLRADRGTRRSARRIHSLKWCTSARYVMVPIFASRRLLH